MKVICPVTKKECPYLHKLETDVCPREHYCDQVRDSLSKITKKPPSIRKRIILASAFLVIAAALFVYFFVFDNFLFNKKNAEGPDVSDPPPVNSDASGIGVKPTANPSFEPVPTPSPLPEIPVTGNPAEAPARIVVGGIEAEILPVPLDEYGMIKVVHSPSKLSWYEESAIPGEDGSGIIFGYKYYMGMAGIFNSLDSLEPGDNVGFTLDNGENVELTVYDVTVYENGRLDEDVLSVSIAGSRTVLISETGDIDPESDQYDDLVAVFLN
jgi:hypothetical protein